MNYKLQSYFIGVLWFLLSLLSSSVNDIITKYTGNNLSSYEITFWRFLFGTLTLTPFIVYKGSNIIKTSRPFIHICRGGLLFAGMSGWAYGLTIVKVSTATVVSFTIPLFVLILGIFFLKEHIIWQRWVATIIGFIGIFVTLNPMQDGFDSDVIVLVFATMAFAVLDIINKRFVVKESMISMLFYSALITTLLAFPFALKVWQIPSGYELLLLFILGGSANLILYFILKAFMYADATALSPYRYLELLLSSLLAFIVFNEMPGRNEMIGAAIIVPTTLFIIYSEKKQLTKTEG